jgi:hypothetical protein
LFWWGFFVIFLIGNEYCPTSNLGEPVLVHAGDRNLGPFGSPFIVPLGCSGHVKLIRRTCFAFMGLTGVLIYSSVGQAKARRNTPSLWNDVMQKISILRSLIIIWSFITTHRLINRAGLEYKISLCPAYHLSLIGLGGYYIEKVNLKAIERLYLAINTILMLIPRSIILAQSMFVRGMCGSPFMFFRATCESHEHWLSGQYRRACLRMGESDAAMEVAQNMI